MKKDEIAKRIFEIKCDPVVVELYFPVFLKAHSVSNRGPTYLKFHCCL